MTEQWISPPTCRAYRENRFSGGKRSQRGGKTCKGLNRSKLEVSHKADRAKTTQFWKNCGREKIFIQFVGTKCCYFALYFELSYVTKAVKPPSHKLCHLFDGVSPSWSAVLSQGIEYILKVPFTLPAGWKLSCRFFGSRPNIRGGIWRLHEREYWNDRTAVWSLTPGDSLLLPSTSVTHPTRCWHWCRHAFNYPFAETVWDGDPDRPTFTPKITEQDLIPHCSL